MIGGTVSTLPEQALLGFAAEFSLDQLPAEVRERARYLLLDQIGVQLACSELPWVQQVTRYFASQSAAGPCTIVGGSARVTPEAAAAINGTAGHGFEYDDGCPVASAHPSCAVVPAALAVAEAVDASGAELLSAYVVGAETVVRVARATMPSMLYERGFHETCAHGVLGSALAAGRLLGLPEPRLSDALGIAGSHASGTSEFVNSGGDVKRLHGGLGASGGVRSAYLAASGFSGPSAVLSGKRGFLHAFAPDPRPEWLSRALGDEWELMNIVTKLHCCAGGLIAPVEALGQILTADGIDGAEIEAVSIGTDRALTIHAASGSEPSALDPIRAQFNPSVAIALRILRGATDFDAYRYLVCDGGMTDPKLRELMARVSLHVDSDCDAKFPGARMAKVDVIARGGRTFAAVVTRSRAFAPGPEAITEKFRSLAGRRFDTPHVDALERMILDIESVESARLLGEMLGER